MTEEQTEQSDLEPDISGVPKNFIIRCQSCRWARLSSGVSVDLVDLIEVKANCSNCGKARRFRCPRCGSICHMKRVQGNT